MDVVHEAPPAVDLDDRDPLPVRSLERGVTVDLHLPQLEAELLSRVRDNALRRLAEVATRSGVEDDFGYG